LQDFYAHTNWVEQQGSSIYPALGRWQIGGPNAADPCDGVDPSPDFHGLTSGYFAFNQEFGCSAWADELFKCIHGPPPVVDAVCGLNKDMSPREGFSTAYAAAVDATGDFANLILGDLWKARPTIGDEQYNLAVCGLLGIDQETCNACRSTGGDAD